MIDRDRWQQLSALLDEALALSAGARAAWLTALRERDPSLADDLTPMLAQAADDDTVAAAVQPAPQVPAFDQWLGRALTGPGSGPGGGPGAARDGAAAPLPGQRMGPWQLIEKIGEGGMGQVWLARRADGLYEAQAAIKLLRSDLDSSGLQARFARERAVLARLNHPAVGRLLDAGFADGQAYLVLEYVDGRSLADHVREACPTVAQRVRLLMRIAEAVDHAHAQLIVHRDLKPSNVLVTRDGEPKLLDFGIAGLLDDGGPVDTDLTRQTGRGLTLGYAAPEQILGAPIGTGADVFSLGVMLFELLTGDLPFAPRDSSRLAIERAVLHDEPRRVSLVLAEPPGPMDAADAAIGPGRPSDPARVRGDLEAIVAKALRKDPRDRYGSVRLLMDDLGHWLAHRPISARRDDWRHRSRLWLRRHALLAASVTVVVASLSAGLAAATWQWRRAEAAARQSDQVTTYLTDLLASASPDQHGGQWPTVLQLLERSRQDLPEKFRDDADTRLRLLQVLADTYHLLNRFDISMPLFDELVALSTQRYGADDPRTVRARLHQGRTFQIQGLFDKAIATLEPLLPLVPQQYGAGSTEHRALLYTLSTSLGRVGRLDEADRMLTEVGRYTEAQFPPGHTTRLEHLNHVQVLRNGQGRVRDALAALRATEPYWGDTDPKNSRQQLVLRRNTIAIQIRLGEYDRIEERTLALLADMERLLGAGNDMASGLRHELARYFTEVGQTRRALQQREENLARAQAAGVKHPATLVPLRVAVLLARAQAHAADAGVLLREARTLLAEMDARRGQLGYSRADAWINLARVGLLLDHEGLAAEAMAALHADTGLRLDRDVPLASRVAQIDGELARLRGDLPASLMLMKQRMKTFETLQEPRVLPAWVAALDLAYTQVLMADPQAAETLALAASRRPPAAPAGHPLDAVATYLQARLAHGDDSAPPVREAIDALVRAQGRIAGQPPGAGRGSLGGAFI
ncbi:serine/threonine-protein kinase [Ideonella sp. A 288]|uniref:serine/threonine-protein kinase n=1 Tax=Ideonella sp. A 288 TaxID=1962181 RepID=UPI000B4B63E4|nr:serine/threonine-protein kinase [Ideonella sp. A 288]